MSKRNFTLLIIILGLAIIAIFAFLYLRKPADTADNGAEGTNFISQFNPFETKPAPPAPTPPVDTSGDQSDAEDTQKMKLEKISSMPVAGFGVFTKERFKEVPITNSSPTLPLPGERENSAPPAKEGSRSLKPTPPPTEFVTALRYVDQATGNIYQTFADKIEERKFSATVIPRVYEARFGNRAESVVMRYLKEDGKTIETFVGALPKELLGGDATENNQIKGSFLPNNIQDISVSPDTTKIFYLFNTGSILNENIAGATLNLLNNKKVQIFDSVFTEWLSLWPANNIITLTTKPSANVPGYMYSINGAGKNLTKVLGGINGLTTLGSPNGKLILYGNSNLSLYVYHTDSMNSDLLGIKTLSEKCVWGSRSDIIYCAAPKSIEPGEYPDAWYQGEISFSDQFWKIDVKTGNATLLLDPATVAGGEEIDPVRDREGSQRPSVSNGIDGIKLALDRDENYLFFVNKKDSFLWKLELK